MLQRCEVIASIIGQGALNVGLRCPSLYWGTGVRPISSIIAPPSFDTRPGQQCMQRHEGLYAATQVCMLPRRCLPSWLGQWLRMNGGRNLAGAGLAVALPGRLATVLPGGPARVLPRRVGFPGKDLVGESCGFLRWGRLPSYPHLILIALCLHKDLHATTEVPPEPCPNASA